MHWREKGKVLRVLPSGCSSSIVNLGNAQEKYRFSLVYFFFLVSPIFSMERTVFGKMMLREGDAVDGCVFHSSSPFCVYNSWNEDPIFGLGNQL